MLWVDIPYALVYGFSFRGNGRRLERVRLQDAIALDWAEVRVATTKRMFAIINMY